MARVKRAVNAHKKRRTVLSRAEGYRGQRSRLYRKAKEQVTHSLGYAYRDRKARKGDFRRLWIQRINAAARSHGMTYNRFVQGLRAAGLEVTAGCSPTSQSTTPRLLSLWLRPLEPHCQPIATRRPPDLELPVSRGSLNDPRSAPVRRLRGLRRRETRAEERRFLVEGAHAVEEALTAMRHTGAPDVVVRDLLMTATAAQRHSDLLSIAHDVGVAVSDVSDAVVDALSDTVTPQGVIAVVDFVDVSVGTVVESDPRLVAVLANVRDPGNAGSVVRAADAAGCNGVVFTGESVDPYNGKAVRAAVGGHFHLPLAVDDRLRGVIDEIRAGGLQVLAADGSGSVDLDTANHEGLLAKPTAWVFGNEAWGMPDHVMSLADRVIRIPLYGRAESLNLAMSAALCLYASANAQRLS